MISKQLSHVAIIMDGNGRWALEQDEKRTFGHLHGANNVREIALQASDAGIKTLSLFAFSTENWSRPDSEVSYLMKLPAYFFDRYMQELMDKNIIIKLIGHMERFPESTQKVLKRAIAKSSSNTGMVLNFAMDYGSRDEIVTGIKKYTEEVMNEQRQNSLTVEEFSDYLMTKDYDDVDLLIRTSGEKRLSNYLLWQSAYAEIIFVDKPWPEFMRQDLLDCIKEYEQRERRFGGLL